MEKKWLAPATGLILLSIFGLLLNLEGSGIRELAGGLAEKSRTSLEPAKDEAALRQERRSKRYQQALRQARERGEQPAFVKKMTSNRTGIRWVVDSKERRYPTPFQRLAAINRPRILNSTDLRDNKHLKDNDMVLGVTIGGHARAYLLKSMSNPGFEIVNDNVAGKPVSVSYDWKKQYARVFVNPSQQNDVAQAECFDMYLGGNAEDTLLVGFNDIEYWHDSPDIPLKDHPFTITSWYAWQLLHPHSGAYVGPE